MVDVISENSVAIDKVCPMRRRVQNLKERSGRITHAYKRQTHDN